MSHPQALDQFHAPTKSAIRSSHAESWREACKLATSSGFPNWFSSDLRRWCLDRISQAKVIALCVLE
jgi:hypothetical protein